VRVSLIPGPAGATVAFLSGLLLLTPACQPCDCPALPQDTGDNGITPDPDDGDDRDRFRPGRMAVEGAFAYDPDTGNAVPWVDRDEARELQLFVRMTDDRYLGSADERHRCRVQIVPDQPVEARLQPFAFSFGSGDPERDYLHLTVTLEPGTFQVVDAPFETRDGQRVQGCLEVQDDPDRGFSLRFADGDLERWARDIAWGLGVGDLAPVVRDDILAQPQTSYLRELWDFGLIGGGSARVQSPHHDFLAPTGLALATDLTEEREVLYDRGLPVLLPAQDFVELSDERPPPAALFTIHAMYAITFE